MLQGVGMKKMLKIIGIIVLVFAVLVVLLFVKAAAKAFIGEKPELMENELYERQQIDLG